MARHVNRTGEWLLMRVAVRESPCCEASGPWNLPVALDGDGRGGDAIGLGQVRLVLRGAPTPDGLRYTWAEHTALTTGITVTSRVEDAEHGHTTVTGRVLIGWDDPAGLDTDEAAVIDAHDRRWDVTGTTPRPGSLQLALRRTERVIERGDRPWA